MYNNELAKMDYQRYAKALEDIIDRIELPDTTRKLVDVLVKEARKEARI